MNSKHFSNIIPCMNSTCDVSKEGNTPFKEPVFPQEQISFDFTSFDDQPSVTIEYDYCNNQPDPLGVEETFDVPNFVSSTNRRRKIKICHPFSQQEEEVCDLTMSRSRDSFHLCEPPRVACCCGKHVELGNSEQEKVIEISSDDEPLNLHAAHSSPRKKPVRSEETGTQTQFFEENGGEHVDKDIPGKSLLADQLDDVVCLENGPSKRLKELNEQMLQKIEDRRLAANHLRHKKSAETAFAKRIVRQIMKPEGQPVRNSPAPIVSKQQRNAESALARQLVQHMSKGVSLEEAIFALRSTTPLLKLTADHRLLRMLLTPVNHKGRANKKGVANKHVTGMIGEMMKREPPKGMKGQQRRKAQSYSRGPCFAQPVVGSNQSKVKGDHNVQLCVPQVEVSSSKASTLQPELPSYPLAFNSSDSADNNFVEGLQNPRFLKPNTCRSLLTQVPTPSNRASSAVHPSHLLPPSSNIPATITIDDDFIISEAQIMSKIILPVQHNQ